MLISFRSHIKGWIAWVFVILVSVPFALWGIGNYSSVIAQNYVASVNGTEISQQTFQNAYRNAYQQRQKTMGAKFDPSPAQQKAFKHQVLQQLVTRTLLRQQAEKYHMVASSAQVQGKIRQMPVFQVNGKFKYQRYLTVLRANNMTPEQFEARVRTNLKSQLFQRSLVGSTFATPELADSMLALSNEQRKVAWLTLPLSGFKPAKTPTDAEIKAWYHDHEQAFTTPKTVTIQYVQLDSDTLIKDIKPTKQDLLAWYHSNLSAFGTPPARKAAEILIKPDQENEQGWASARTRAVKLLSKIKQSGNAKKTFATLAEKYSDDPISSRNEGAIGYVGRGQMPTPFDTALFGMDSIGSIAGPVRTDEGWVLIQLLAKRQGQVKPYAQVKNEVKEKYTEAQISDSYYKQGERLANLAFENPASLEPIAEKLNLEIRTESGITRKEGTGIAANDDIREAAFSNAVLKKHQNSEPVKLGDLDAVVLRVSDVQPSKLQPLAEVRDQIVANIEQTKAATAADEAADHAITQLREGKTFDQVARSLHIKAKGPATISRASPASSVPKPVALAAFSKPVPAHKQALYGKTTLQNGATALVALLSVASGEASKTSPQARQAYISQFSRMHANQEMSAYVDWLRSQADIKINEDQIP